MYAHLQIKIIKLDSIFAGTVSDTPLATVFSYCPLFIHFQINEFKKKQPQILPQNGQLMRLVDKTRNKCSTLNTQQQLMNNLVTNNENARWKLSVTFKWLSKIVHMQRQRQTMATVVVFDICPKNEHIFFLFCFCFEFFNRHFSMNVNSIKALLLFLMKHDSSSDCNGTYNTKYTILYRTTSDILKNENC